MDGQPRAFVKFLGSSRNRVELSHQVIEEIQSSGCHWSVAYPATKRPRQVNDGDIIFVGRLTEEPNDIRIFGRAKGIQYKEGRDDATQADIELRPWKERWSRYIRVYDGEFIDGAMSDAVSLNELMATHRHLAFMSTKRNSENGVGNLNPKRAYNSSPAVELSSEGFRWLNERLDQAFRTVGKISLPRPP